MACQHTIKSLTALAERLGVKEKLLFLHSKTDIELAEVYAGCDVFIYPSHLTWKI